jgi:TonB family protein
MRSWRPAYHQGVGRRVAVALVLSCLVHAGLAPLLMRALSRPGRAARSERVHFWEGHTGAYGPIQLMPEINLAHGDDPLTRPARAPSAAATPRPRGAHSSPQPAGPPAAPPSSGPVLPEPVSADESRSDRPETEQPFATGVAGPPTLGQVELNRASQTTLDFVLTHFVRPSYPAGVPAALLGRAIVVHVAMYVDPGGSVAQAYVVSSEGGPLFDEAVLAAVRQWKYRPVVVGREPRPFWDQVKVTFVGAQSGTPGSVRVNGG